jgi:hypothetical protein
LIEIAFTFLKGKWRKLKFLDVTNLSLIPHILIAACVLHNYILNVEGDEWNEDFDFDIEGDKEMYDEFEEGRDDDERAVDLRKRIANLF